MRCSALRQGPLALLIGGEGLHTFDRSSSERVLLAYYRILQANRDLPLSLGWSLVPLSQIIWDAQQNPGPRFLAIQCYALQAGMIEEERVKMEKEVVGDFADTDCPIEYGASIDGAQQYADGWLLHITESTRLMDARNALLAPQNYYTYDTGDSIEPIHPAQLRYVGPSLPYETGGLIHTH